MKRYTSRETKRLAVYTSICGAVLLVGNILIFAQNANIGLTVGLILLSGLLGVIFLSCFLAEKSRDLIIDADKIIFPRGAEKNGKMVFQKTVIRKGEISSVESKFHKGDKFFSDDCFFYTLKLKDGTNITVTLYAYGKEAEKEILEIIQGSIA